LFFKFFARFHLERTVSTGNGSSKAAGMVILSLRPIDQGGAAQLRQFYLSGHVWKMGHPTVFSEM
jgi:hypothetical protein